MCTSQNQPAVLRNAVSSEIHNWGAFTAVPVLARADTSFKKIFPGAQLLIWEALRLSGLSSLKKHGIACTGLLSPLLYCDNRHKSCIVRPPFLAVSRSCAIASGCAHHTRMIPTWHVLMTSVTFYTATDTHCQPCGLIRFQVK